MTFSSNSFYTAIRGKGALISNGKVHDEVLSISGLISAFIEMFSAIIAIYKFDIKKLSN